MTESTCLCSGPPSPFLSRPPTVRNLMTPPLSPHLSVTFHPVSLLPRVLPPTPSLSHHFPSLHPYFQALLPLTQKHFSALLLFHDGNAATGPGILLSAGRSRGGKFAAAAGAIFFGMPRRQQPSRGVLGTRPRESV